MAYWEYKQYYLRIFRPSALFVDVFNKHATLPTGIGTITQRGPVNISYNISSFWKVIFTNLMLHLCQSDFLCRCQMYPFNAFYVTYGGNYKRYPQCSTCERIRLAFQWLCLYYDMYIWPFFSCFQRGKCRLLYFYINISLKRSNIYLLSSTGMRWKTISGHFVRLLLQLGAAQHCQFAIQRRADAIVCSLARLTIDDISGCGVTRYREELRIFVKL